jgi:hypothetical protein
MRAHHVRAQENEMNPFTKQPHTVAYKKILEARKKLPVYAQMKEFYEMVSEMRPRTRRGGQTAPLQARGRSSRPSSSRQS